LKDLEKRYITKTVFIIGFIRMKFLFIVQELQMERLEICFSLIHIKNDLALDVIQDVKEINKLEIRVQKSVMIIIAGEAAKHHILNAHIWKNGVDYVVYII
jgi:hypothetical protein